MSHLKPLKYRKLTFSMCLLFVLTFSISFGQGFVTTWKTDNSGTSNNDQITIPVTGNYTINWEEVDNVTNSGTVSASGTHTLTFPNSGIYRVVLSGNLTQIQFDGSGDKNKILSIESWGDISWTSMESAFNGCINLVYNATDIPNLSNVTNCSEMFRSCTVFNGDINNWDVSTITDMSFMFRASGFNKKLSAWDVSNVTTMRFMFKNASAFDRNLGNWNITQVTNMIGMLDGTALLPINYDRTLIGWASQAVQHNIDLGVDGLQYCTGETARNNLIANKNWTFSADALKPNCKAFITTWKTDNVGSSNNNQITIPGTGSYNITWEEIGNSSNNGTANATDTQTITFPNSGMYYIEITGGLTRINFSNFGDKEKILSIEQWGAPVWTSMENAFSGCKNLVINALDAPNLSSLTNCYQMFRDCTALTGDLSNWNVSNVTIMRAMFRGCTLFTGDLSNWNVSNVVSMRSMFFECTAFSSDLSDWSVSNVTTMESMFYECNVFNSDLNNWSVSNVTNMRSMFSGCEVFNSDLSNWNVSNVTTMRSMFFECNAFNSDLSNWNVSSVTTMETMFYECNVFNSDLSNWNVSNVQSFFATFAFAKIFNSDINSWVLNSATNTVYMFASAKDFDQNLGGWNMENVTDMSDMLRSCGMSQNNYDKTLFGWATQNVQPNLTLGANTLEYCVGEIPRNKLINDKGWTITGDSKVANCEFITTWKTDNSGDSNNNQVILPGAGNYLVAWENVNDTSINGFTTATGEQTITFPSNGTYSIKTGSDFRKLEFGNFTGDAQKLLTIEQWGNAQWLSMKKAFNGCSNLTYNATDVPDLSTVTNCSDMFTNCISFNGDISNWDVSNITNMTSMFGFCNVFNQDLSNWTVNSVTNMNFMFGGAKAFNGNISGWNVANVTSMESLFFNAEEFNRNLENWNTSNVTSMQNMFSGAVDFNQNLGNWDVSLVSNMQNMLNNSGLSTNNYDATLIGWNALPSVQTNVILDASATYCASATARIGLQGKGWMINDGGLDVACTTFNTTWQTTTPNESITIPTTGDDYNYDVDWGDGTVETGFTGDASHTYVAAGIYTVKVSGAFSRIFFNNTGDKDKILSIEQWGVIAWINMADAFEGCTNLQVNATDAPDLSGVTNCSRMFRNCTTLNANFNHWDVSNIRLMPAMFNGNTNFNGEINAWETTSLEVTTGMFRNATHFNQDISGWTMDNVIKTDNMFFNANAFNQPIGNWNVSNVYLMNDMFNNADVFNQSLGNWNVSNVTTMNNMLRNAIAFSTASYDATLKGWSELSLLQNNVALGADGLSYCASYSQRQNIMDAYGWTITDAGRACPVVISPKVYLQGASIEPITGEETLMRDNLRTLDLIPLTSIYTDGIKVNPNVFNVAGDDAIVDWIWIELRDQTDATIVIDGQSALLQRDGDIVSTDGITDIGFNQSADNYYTVIKHRNHLGVMTALAESFSATTKIIDFTDANNQITHGVNAQTTFGMPTDKVGMWTGNVNGDTVVQYSGTTPDAPSILSNVLNASGNFLNFPTYVVTGYNVHDVDMNGETQYTGTAPDVPYLLQNILAHPGNFLNFSTYGIQEQLPEN